MVADSFLVCFGLPFLICSLAFTFALFGFGLGLLRWHGLFCRLVGLSGVYVARQNSALGLALRLRAAVKSAAALLVFTKVRF